MLERTDQLFKNIFGNRRGSGTVTPHPWAAAAEHFICEGRIEGDAHEGLIFRLQKPLALLKVYDNGDMAYALSVKQTFDPDSTCLGLYSLSGKASGIYLYQPAF